MAHLILVRHGTSEYNAKGLWAGWDDPALNEEGKKDAAAAGESLKDIDLHAAFCSSLIRHKQTLDIILQIAHKSDLPIIESDALKERNYGDFTAKNKWQVKEEIGEENFMKLRRSWDYPVPHGESLKQVYERVIPYYQSTILPKIESGENVIIASSGNALRALVKYLENIADENVATLEIAPGEVYVYTIDANGTITNKEIRNQHENKV
jgi:2,3-bisphosphoglycerate-dependent phosphoglycerate mutase